MAGTSAFNFDFHRALSTVLKASAIGLTYLATNKYPLAKYMLIMLCKSICISLSPLFDKVFASP
jgi:hypothetical protein